MSDHYFTCPKCGGHYFGTDFATGEVQCHCLTDGGAVTYWDEANKMWRARPLMLCKWRGKWPDRQGVNTT